MTETTVAVHLAAGEGTRLRPLTNDKPKPLVELGETSLLERNVNTLSAAGITDQVVVTGYKSDQINELGYNTVHNPIYDKTDMVYSLFQAQNEFDDQRDLVISYGDIAYEQEIAESLLDCDAPICVVVDREWRNLWDLRFTDPLEDAETLQMDDQDRITEIGSEPDGYDSIEGQYIGLIKVRNDYIEAFGNHYDELSGGGKGLERSSVEMTHFLQHLIDEGWQVQGVPITGGWVEVDTYDELKRYRDRLDDDDVRSIVSDE